MRCRLGPAVRRHSADLDRGRCLDGYLLPAGRSVRVQGGDQPVVGRELRGGRQSQRFRRRLWHRRRSRSVSTTTTARTGSPIPNSIRYWLPPVTSSPRWDARPTPSPTCMRSWLQDPDRDGTYSFSTIDIPAGTYTVGVGSSAVVSFTVEQGLATTINYQRATNTVTVETFVPDFGPDLSADQGRLAAGRHDRLEHSRRARRVDVPAALGSGRTRWPSTRRPLAARRCRCGSTRAACRVG